MTLKQKNQYFQYSIIGFITSIILTIIQFLIVTIIPINNKNILNILRSIILLLQIIIHFIYFLHIHILPEKYWYIMSIFFTLFVMIILIIGSLWIMHHLHQNLMYH